MSDEKNRHQRIDISMQTESSQKPISRKKVIGFIAFIIFLFALLCAFWFYAAGKIDQGVHDFNRQLSHSGRLFKCGKQEVRGFPFRLGIFCDDIIYGDPVNSITLKSGALRSAAQLYNPGHVVAEMDGPMDLTIPGFAPLKLDWENLQSSGKFTTSGFKRTSTAIDQFKISANDAGLIAPLATIGNLEMHARKSINLESSLDLSFIATEWEIDDGGSGLIEPIEFELDITLEELLAILNRGEDVINFLQNNGGKSQIRTLRLQTENGGLIYVRGSLEVSSRGLLSGDLIIDLEDPEKLMNFTANVFPPAEQPLSEVTNYLAAFADLSGGVMKIRDFKIKIIEGKVLAGFFTIAELPRLF